MNEYSMIIQWSDEDQLYLVTIPEFSQVVVMPCTYGKTRLEALKNAEEVIEMYRETLKSEGKAVPEPTVILSSGK